MHQHRGVLLERVALFGRFDSDHGSIRGKCTRPEAKHDPPPRQVVEHRQPVRHPQRIMVRKRDDAGAEPDMLRLRRYMRNEHHRVANGFGPARMMLADPRFIETDRIH